jgi:hypothetical protein
MITWLREGDANTSLFHSHARYRMKKIFISKLVVEGRTVTSHEEKAQLLLNFYSNPIGSREQRHNTIDLAALGVQQHDLHMLDVPNSEEEVWNTIRLLPFDKAPRLDGITRYVGPLLRKTSWLRSRRCGEGTLEISDCLIQPISPCYQRSPCSRFQTHKSHPQFCKACNKEWQAD